MIRYEVLKLKRVGDYAQLSLLLKQYSIRNISLKENKDRTTKNFYFSIPKSDAPEISNLLKESGLEFKTLE